MALTHTIDRLRGVLADVAAEDLARMSEGLALTSDEHFTFQQVQSEAHAGGRLSTDDALVVYAALGEVGDPGNGLWAADTDGATKLAITHLMAGLIRERVEA